MKILMIFPSVGYYTRGLGHPIGLLSIGTYLKQNGYDVKIYDRCVDKTKIDDVLNDFSPDIVGVSVISSRGLKDAIKISKHIKAKGNQPVIWGGPLASMHINLILENDFVDIVSFSEGEETWKELAYCFENNKPIFDIDGIAYKKDGKIIQNPYRPFVDLGEIPVADWSLLDVPKYMLNYMGCHKMMYILSSKGCPYRCAFCENSIMHKCTHRKRPNDKVIEEIKYLIENYGLDGVYFSDEMWVLKRSDMVDFCQRVHDNNLNFHWGIEFRVGMFNEEDFQMMYDAGCRWIFFGIESGNPEMSKKIRKSINLEDVKPTVEALRRIGITSVCSYIIGFPDETVEQVQDTINLINNARADLNPLHYFNPLPGTELFDEVVAQKGFEGPKNLKELSKVVTLDSVGTNFSKIPTKDLRVIRSWFDWKGFTNKTAISSEKSYGFAKQTILNGLRFISSSSPIKFFVNGFAALREFLYVFWYSHAYPGIRKKYNLKK